MSFLCFNLKLSLSSQTVSFIVKLLCSVVVFLCPSYKTSALKLVLIKLIVSWRKTYFWSDQIFVKAELQYSQFGGSSPFYIYPWFSLVYPTTFLNYMLGDPPSRIINMSLIKTPSVLINQLLRVVNMVTKTYTSKTFWELVPKEDWSWKH